MAHIQDLRSPTPQPRRITGVNWIGVWTLYAKEVRRFLKVINQTVSAPIVTTLMFLAVFTLALDRRIEIGDGISFSVFLVPGLVMMAILQNSFANTSSSIVTGKIQGNIVDVLMPPLGPGELTFAYAAGAVTRGLVVGTGTVIVLSAVVGILPVNPVQMLFFAVMGSLMLGLVGIIAGMWADKFDHLSSVTNFVITPLTFLSGTFYSIDRLPGYWNNLAHMNPIFYLIDGFRGGMIGWSDTAPWIGALLVAGINLALVAVSYRLLRSGYKLKA
jgi:ABC-2 type transport system permease protein